jgi:hypothetical protein
MVLGCRPFRGKVEWEPNEKKQVRNCFHGLGQCGALKLKPPSQAGIKLGPSPVHAALYVVTLAKSFIGSCPIVSLAPLESGI